MEWPTNPTMTEERFWTSGFRVGALVHKPTTRKMSDKHEAFLAELFGEHSSVMPGSGSGWAKQMDVRGKHLEEEYAFAVDGKSTFRESISVSLAMWEKAVEQAHNEIPALALRWYSSYQLDSKLDLVVIEAQTFKAMKECAEEWPDLVKRIVELEEELEWEQMEGR